jgi:hypothetical protein
MLACMLSRKHGRECVSSASYACSYAGRNTSGCVLNARSRRMLVRRSDGSESSYGAEGTRNVDTMSAHSWRRGWESGGAASCGGGVESMGAPDVGVSGEVGVLGSSEKPDSAVVRVDTREMYCAVRAGVGSAKLNWRGPGLSFCCASGRAKKRRRYDWYQTTKRRFSTECSLYRR